MRATERRIYHFDIEVKRRGHVTHLPKLIRIIDVWKERSEAGTAFQERSSGDLVFAIEDVQVYDNNICCILLSVTDRNSSEAVYGDLKTGEATVHSKTDTQGGMYSAHIVVSTDPYKADTYYCVIEYAIKLNQSNIELLLNHVLHDEYRENKDRFTFPDPAGRRNRGGEVKRTSFLPRVELKGYPSDELIESLEGGKIRDIVLIDTTERAAFGDNPYLVEKNQSLTVGVKPEMPKGTRFESIKAAVSRRSEQYAKARIRFVGQDKRPRSVDFDVADGSIIDTRNIKSEVLNGITPPLADASKEIVSRLVRPMMQIVRNQRQS